MNIKKILKDFPILSQKMRGRRMVYLDSAATSQKPKSVIDAISAYYENSNANVHRGVYELSENATLAFENTRKKIASFIGSKDARSIVFTKNASEALNLIAQSWGEKNIKEGDEILLTEMEHHSNIVPWQMIAHRKGAKLKYVGLLDDGTLDLSNIDELLTPQTKVFAFTHMSNALGTINPVKELTKLAHDKNITVVVDGAQAAPHMKVNVSALDCDFYVFSAHKMLGPTGVGALYGKLDILEAMPPFLGGGEMILEVNKEYSTWKQVPEKFEAGTPNIAGVIAFAKAIEYLEGIGMDNVRQHEKEITEYALKRFKELEGVCVIGSDDIEKRGGAISFNFSDIHPHDLGTLLDHQGIAIRTGHHCAQLVMKRFDVGATARASFYIYNTREDVDALIKALCEAKSYFGGGKK